MISRGDMEPWKRLLLDQETAMARLRDQYNMKQKIVEQRIDKLITLMNQLIEKQHEERQMHQEEVKYKSHQFEEKLTELNKAVSVLQGTLDEVHQTNEKEYVQMNEAQTQTDDSIIIPSSPQTIPQQQSSSDLSVIIQDLDAIKANQNAICQALNEQLPAQLQQMVQTLIDHTIKNPSTTTKKATVAKKRN